MEAQMKAMTDAFLPVEGLSNTSAASLFDVGYTRAGKTAVPSIVARTTLSQLLFDHTYK